MTCLTDLEIVGFVEGGLPSEIRLHAEMHIDECSLCFSVVAGIGRTVAQEYRPVGEATPGPLLADGQHRYVPGPEIAHGGMGRILAGEDRLLGRPVALKLLRRSSASLARRFLREQRISARLQHPAIVPVYDVGVLDDGETFLVMRLVKGQSLDRVAARSAALAERLLLLPAVLAVVDAVAYAHSEGVVHRDLKPQNVLVGPFGEVVVLDWGLARAINATIDPEDDMADVDPGDGEAGLTCDGERLGTVAYMAPEQAAGREADARTDVYGLGAILYHVLTGRPPHAERTTSLSTGAVLHAPPPLVQLAPHVPQDLGAIVARAMASEPAARYASALELAADLKRWQAGRLVEAHRYSLRELLRRFRHRHRTPLLVAAAALLVLLALGGVSLWRIFAERGRALAAMAVAEDARLHAEDAQAVAEHAQTVAKDARLRAETQRVAAEKLVNFVLDDLRPRVEHLGRLDVLTDVARAVMAYQASSTPLADADAWLRRAQAAALAGDVAFKNGDIDTAEEGYRVSREAAAKAGDAEAATLVQCRAANGLGDVDYRRGKWATAAPYYEACEVLTRDIRDAAGPELRLSNLRSRLGLAVTTPLASEPVVRRRLLEEGLAEAVELAGADDPDSDVSRIVEQFRRRLWLDLFEGGEVAAAREMALSWVALDRARIAAGSTSAGSRHLLAVWLFALGQSEVRLGHTTAAERACQESLGLTRLLVAQDPSNRNWQATQTMVTMVLADILVARGKPAAALPLRQSAVDAWERRTASSPEAMLAQENLCRALLARGDLLGMLGRLGDARDDYQRAVNILQDLTERVPRGKYGLMLSVALTQLGGLELSAHRIRDGQAHLQRSIDILRLELAARDTPEIRRHLAASLAGLAESERGAAARGYIEEAVALLEPLREATAGNPELQQIMKDVARAQRALRAKR